MQIETETDFSILAAQDAEMRDLSGIEFPTRDEVENGKPTPKDDRLTGVMLRDDTHAARQRNDLQAAAPFVIDDELKAGWVLRKLARNADEIARVKAQAAARISELEADARALESRFSEPLKVWAQGEAARRRRKSVTLLDGTLSFRTQPRKLIMTAGGNEEAFVHARTAFPDCIKRTEPTEYLDTRAYIAEAERTGELLPGMDCQPEREAFKIDVGPAKGNISRSREMGGADTLE